jgi:hypothetical protein
MMEHAMELAVGCYVLGVPGAALVTCLVCRRYRVLLWLGGLLAVPIGSLALLHPWHRPGPDPYELDALETATLSGVPILEAGLILLVGGAVHWVLSRWPQ